MWAYWRALPRRKRQRFTGSLGVGALLVFPFVDLVFNLQLLNAVTDAAVFVILALGLNIVVGYAGLLDLGYAAFFAILILVLVFRPWGFLGQPPPERY